MKRLRYLAPVFLIGSAAGIALFRSWPSPNAVIQFRILRYTTNVSGLQAFIQFTNSHKDLSWEIQTEFSTNGIWRRSSSQPAFGSYPPMLTAKWPDYNVWIPV